MSEPSETLGSMRFGRFELSVDTGELRKDGVRLKLSGQAIQVLAMLAANAGNLATREQLQQQLWPGASYGDAEHGLNAAVNQLRDTPGDSASDPKYIETVPGRGYRFIASLDSPAGLADQPDNVIPIKPPEPEPVEPDPPLTLPWWRRKAPIAIAACVVNAGLLYLWVAPQIERM